MNTAKTLQLLDAQNNNISPATNIESLYYEVMDSGVIYRNSIYKHFPIYVKYNNNVDNPIAVQRGNAVTTGAYVHFFKDDDAIEPAKGDASSFRLSLKANQREDIFISSIRQSKLRNTRYYKLDVSTYNLSDIMSLYAPKLWIQNTFDEIDIHFDNIIYKSDVITKTTETGEQSCVFVEDTVGAIEAKTIGTDLHKKTLNQILDKLFFKEILPYVYNAYISMSQAESYTQVNFDNVNYLNATGTATFTMSQSIGKLKLVHYASSVNLPADPNSKLIISFNSPAKTFTLDECVKNANGYYKDIITTATITSSNLYPPTQKEQQTSEWKTNYGNVISAADYRGIYESYGLPYNDYNNESDILKLTVKQDGTVQVNNTLQLTHRSYIYMPIAAEQNNETTQVQHVTGTGEKYVDFIQDQSKDFALLIPRAIDAAYTISGSTVTINKDKLPELCFSNHHSDWSATTDWIISTISWQALQYNRYVIKGDNFGGKRQIRIKIYTK